MEFLIARALPAAVIGRSLLVAILLVQLPLRAHADAGWIESGDTGLRMDLQLLNDADVIRVPLNQWPIPKAMIDHALKSARDHFAVNAAVMAALERVRARMEAPRRKSSRPYSFSATATGGEPGLFRDFDTLARENAGLAGHALFSGERVAASIRLAAVSSPSDGDTLRADGSHLTMQLGNWLLSANTLDRWWGPSHQSSLILSNNARPMPTLMAERATAVPFETPWLNWLGPWRFSFGISQMENEREDIDAPLFMAWRVEFMPFKDIEIGLSRTAQFCGEQLQCSWDVFWNLLIGNDNVGIDTTEEEEPGNQMAGFDIRWSSPIGDWPYAIYSQMIGEDESSYVPAKFLSQHGIEMWKPLRLGGLLQGFIEYSTTTCSANSSSGPYYNCAYNQGRFNVEGYRYRGRVVGHTADRDAENYAMGVTLVTADGEFWSATARTSRLNRDDFGDSRNTVASVPTDFNSIEFGWRGTRFGQRFDVDLGLESIHPEGGERDLRPFGFVRWNYEFGP